MKKIIKLFLVVLFITALIAGFSRISEASENQSLTIPASVEIESDELIIIEGKIQQISRTHEKFSKKGFLKIVLEYQDKEVIAYYFKENQSERIFLLDLSELNKAYSDINRSIENGTKIFIRGYWFEPENIFYFKDVILEPEDVEVKEKSSKKKKIAYLSPEIYAYQFGLR